MAARVNGIAEISQHPRYVRRNRLGYVLKSFPCRRFDGLDGPPLDRQGKGFENAMGYLAFPIVLIGSTASFRISCKCTGKDGRNKCRDELCVERKHGDSLLLSFLIEGSVRRRSNRPRTRAYWRSASARVAPHREGRFAVLARIGLERVVNWRF